MRVLKLLFPDTCVHQMAGRRIACKKNAAGVLQFSSGERAVYCGEHLELHRRRGRP